MSDRSRVLYGVFIWSLKEADHGGICLHRSGGRSIGASYGDRHRDGLLQACWPIRNRVRKGLYAKGFPHPFERGLCSAKTVVRLASERRQGGVHESHAQSVRPIPVFFSQSIAADWP
jgi:hypothetical protein